MGNDYPALAIPLTGFMAPLSPKMIEILRAALTRVEGQAGLTSDDPALLEFKRSVVRNVAELAGAEEIVSSGTADASEAGDSQSDNAA